MLAGKPIQFYDSSNPSNIASGLHAAVYRNGDFAWPQDEIDRMAAVFGISVEREPSWARLCRCIDIENGAGGPEDAAPFCQERWRLGYDDATVYVNRSNRDDVIERLSAVGLVTVATRPRFDPYVFDWVATLDGTNVPGSWASQIHGGIDSPYDVSVLNGTYNFHKP